MQVVILAGGYGTRISEESHLKPKPMIEIGGRPILWHIMKYYSHFGYNDFIICCGYKGYVIKEYFANYYLHHSNVTFDFGDNNRMEIHSNLAEPWRVTLVDTGLNTATGGRIRRIKEYISGDAFLFTYGDGVSDVDLNMLIRSHHPNESVATITAVQPGARFGIVDINDGSRITSFTEKGKENGGWINGGFMILSTNIFDYIEGDQTVFEKRPLERLAAEGKLGAYRHYGFWQCMDTMRDQYNLEELIAKNEAPWMIWK